MAGSMGLSVNNTKAVFEGLLKKRSEFVRTPKYHIMNKKDFWTNKKYARTKFDYAVLIESALALYCLFGVGASIYYLEISAIPFQLLFASGFGLVAALSLKHAWLARKLSAHMEKEEALNIAVAAAVSNKVTVE
jgi:hypothetical protein